MALIEDVYLPLLVEWFRKVVVIRVSVVVNGVVPLGLLGVLGLIGCTLVIGRGGDDEVNGIVRQ